MKSLLLVFLSLFIGRLAPQRELRQECTLARILQRSFERILYHLFDTVRQVFLKIKALVQFYSFSFSADLLLSHSSLVSLMMCSVLMSSINFQ